MSTDRRMALAVALAAVVVPAGVPAQTTAERVEGMIELSLPAKRPVAFEYAISTNLDGINQLSLDANGVFEGPNRLAFDLHSSTWQMEKGAHFLVTGASVAFKEDPTEEEPGEERKWRLFLEGKEARRDPVYASLLLPGAFLSQVGSYTNEFRECGTRGIGVIVCQGFTGAIEPRRARSLLADFGLVLDDGDEIENVVGSVTFWVCEADSLLRGIELQLQTQVKMKRTGEEEKDPGPGAGAGGFSWDAGTDDHGPGALRKPLTGSGPAGGGPSADVEAAVRRTPERAFEILLSLDQAIEEGARPAAAIEPDPAAAELVGW